MSSNDYEPLWTVKDTATFLNIAEKTIRNKVSLDQIPHVKVGGSLRFEPAAIRQWVEDQNEVSAA